MYIEKVFDFLFQLVKNGSENKRVAFTFLFSVLCTTALCSVLQQRYYDGSEGLIPEERMSVFSDKWAGGGMGICFWQNRLFFFFQTIGVSD